MVRTSWACWLLVLGLAACVSEPSTTPAIETADAAGGAPGIDAALAPRDVDGGVTIGPAGGVLSTGGDGGATLSLPAGAVSEPHDLAFVADDPTRPAPALP